MLWQVIEKHLEKKGWSIYKLAKELGVNESSIRNIKTGRSDNPSFQLIKMIADTLEFSLDEFKEDK